MALVVGLDATVVWRGTGHAIREFRIYRRPATAETWTQIGSMTIDGPSPGNFEFIDGSPPAGEYVYGVSTFNFYDNESEIRETPQVSVP
jgi:hypothetical protein